MRLNPASFLLPILTLTACADASTNKGDVAENGTQGSESDADTDSDTDTDTDSDSDTDIDSTADTEDTEAEDDTGAESDCDDQTQVVLFISPDDSNSTASPVLARELAGRGASGLSGFGTRPWEFFNYYSWDYEPDPASSLSITTEMIVDPTGEPDRYVLQIGVRAPDWTNETRPPYNLTFAVDTSGSMGSQDRLGLAREIGVAVASQLREGDHISLISWSTIDNTILNSFEVTGPDEPSVVDAFKALTTGGGTNLNNGLVSAYQLASSAYDPDSVNRVILVSDGGANAGVTSIDTIAEHADDGSNPGVYLAGIGVGTASGYNDRLMDTVTDAGRGASLFIDSSAEVQRMMVDHLMEVMGVAAEDVSVRLTLPPGFTVVQFSGEEISTNPAEVEPQNLSPNDSMVFYQVIETCAPEQISADSVVEVTVTWTDPESKEPRTLSSESNFSTLLSTPSPQIFKGTAVYAYAQTLGSYSNLTATERTDLLDATLARVSEAAAMLPADADLAEIQGVLEGLY